MMDTATVNKELKAEVALFAAQAKAAAPWCAEYHSPNASAVLTAIASLIAAGAEGADSLSPRKCWRCGGWFAGEVGR